MPSLTVKSPEFAGQVFELNQPTITIGRAEDNTYQLPHPSVSSHHAELRAEDGDYRLVDLGSTNGSRVNDERITETVLRNGDVVMLGNMILAYQSEVAVAAAPMPTSDNRVHLETSTPTGRPADFKSISPFPKPKAAAASGGGVFVGLASLIAIGGFGFLIFNAFFA